METVEIRCPYCGEVNSIPVEWGAHGAMIHDCWVCCRPIRLDIRWDEWGDPVVTARTEDE
jgi:hypothetical protein